MRHLLSAIRGFLGTYTSRYSELDGYWLWGSFTLDAKEITIDLIGDYEAKHATPAIANAIRLAKSRFEEQLSKVDISKDKILNATLKISTLNKTTDAPVNEVMSKMNVLRFNVAVNCQQGQCITECTEILVAPHNPAAERRSLRASRVT